MDIWIILSLCQGISEFSLYIYPYCLARHAFSSCRNTAKYWPRVAQTVNMLEVCWKQKIFYFQNTSLFYISQSLDHLSACEKELYLSRTVDTFKLVKVM